MQNHSKQPLVSIVIPCRNEEGHIGRCLESVLAQTYPHSRMEILIADGRSTDGTRRTISQVAARHPSAAIRILDNPERFQAPGCNRAIAESRGDVIARMDAHAEYHPEYIERAVAALAATGAANVGCAARPSFSINNGFQHALAVALRSRLSMGGASYWCHDREGWVDTVWNGVFPRTTFEQVGLFDPRARTNEDAEFNLRIAKAGRGVFLCRSMIASYFPRTSALHLARQYFRYGQGRARTVLKHRTLQSYRPLAPALLVLALTLQSALALLTRGAGVVMAVFTIGYLLGISIESARLGLRHGPRLSHLIALILPIIHLAHGCGFLSGLLRYGLRPNWTTVPDFLPPRRLPPRLAARLRKEGEQRPRAEDSHGSDSREEVL